MPQAFSSLFGNLSGANGGGNQAGAAGGLAGGIGGILQAILQGQQLSKVNSIENESPAKLGSQVAQATQPLSAGLTQSVGNVVQANMAERGLSQAPGIFATAESQALAPFYQQNQQTALALISQKLGMPLETLTALMRGSSPQMSNLFTKLALGNQTPATPGITPPTFGSDTSNFIPQGTGGGAYGTGSTFTDPTFGGGDGVNA